MQNLNELRVGDIVWAKVGKYPFWPSIVCAEPNSNKYSKGDEDKIVFLHVRFFNDNARRSWIRQVEMYSTKAELLTKYPKLLDTVNTNNGQIKTWDLAIEEANSMLLLDREKRIPEFNKKYKLKNGEVEPKNVKKISKRPVGPSKNKLLEKKKVKNTRVAKRPRTEPETSIPSSPDPKSKIGNKKKPLIPFNPLRKAPSFVKQAVEEAELNEK